MFESFTVPYTTFYGFILTCVPNKFVSSVRGMNSQSINHEGLLN